MPHTTAYYIDTRRKLKDGRYPLKLEVYDGTRQHYFKVIIKNKKATFTQKEWRDILSTKRDPDLQEIRTHLNALLKKANKIMDSLPHFSAREFGQRWNRPISDRSNVFTWFEMAAEEAKTNSTKGWYRNAAKSFREYAKTDRLQFNDISPAWLARYEQWIAEQGKSQTTASMYLRAMRSVFNDAIDAREIDRDLYPFGRRSFTVPEAANPKRALSSIELDAVLEYVHPDPYHLRMWARDVFVFSLLFSGLGPADIFRLRWENIDEWQTVVDRQKTKGRRRKTAKPVHVYFTEPARDIMRKWSGPDRTGYVFGVLSDGMTEAEKWRKVKNETRSINRQLDKVLTGLSLMAARHTFAEMLSASGTDITRISRALGHGDVKTTQNYLGAFASDEAKEAARIVADRLGGRAPSE